LDSLGQGAMPLGIHLAPISPWGTFSKGVTPTGFLSCAPKCVLLVQHPKVCNACQAQETACTRKHFAHNCTGCMAILLLFLADDSKQNQTKKWNFMYTYYKICIEIYIIKKHFYINAHPRTNASVCMSRQMRM